MTTQDDFKNFRDTVAGLLETIRNTTTKSAFIPIQDPAMQQQMMAQQGGQPMPPQGGLPMDPAMQQQMMAQQGGQPMPPMDPAMMQGQPPAGGTADYGPVIDQIATGLEQLMQAVQEMAQQNAAEHQQMAQAIEQHEQKIGIMVSALDQPAPAPMGAAAQPMM